MDNNIRKISLNDDFSSLKNIIPISFYFNNQWYSLTKTTKLSDLLINLSQKELAAQCKISPVTIGKLENKLRYPSRIQFLKLKEVMKF